MKIPTVKTSYLGTTVDPPISAKERAQLEKDHQERYLERLILTAFHDHDFALALCEKVANFARGDESLSILIKEAMKKKRGGQVVWTYEYYKLILVHYAHYVEEENGNATRAIARLVEDQQQVSGRSLTAGRMNNYVSNAIDKVPTDSLPEWARPAIEARRKRAERWKGRQGMRF